MMRLLIADDDAVNRRLLQRMLEKWGYGVAACGDGEAAWRLLDDPDSPRLVLSDWMMPELNGIDLCRRIRTRDDDGYTYFILLTARDRRQDLIDGLKAGVDDFISKPFDPDELRYRLKIGERILDLETRILRLAMTDPLTGVLNRRAFFQRGETELRRAEREHTGLGLIMTDIDHFKRVNDRYGHQVGDAVLQAVCRTLQEGLRTYDFLGRFGGEEFIIALPNTGPVDAVRIAERLRAAVAATRSALPQEAEGLAVTASFGVGCAHPAPEAPPVLDELISRVDEALYAAKRAGRNRVCPVSPGFESAPEGLNGAT